MSSGINYISGFASKELVKRISEYAKANSDEFSDFGNAEQEFKVHTYHQIERNDPELIADMQVLAKRVYDFVVNEYPGPFSEFLETKTHIARFETDSKMHEHFDSSRPNDIATLIYLNDDYEGGEIYFPDHGVGFKPQPGDLLCFPDNPDFVHGVAEIASGTRYTTPRWFTRIV
jgi:hypothetical protein